MTIAVTLYLLSLTQTGIVVVTKWPGWAILLIGGLGVIIGNVANFAWLCNLLLIASWALLIDKKSGRAVLCSVAALLGAALFLLCQTVVVSEGGGPGYHIDSVGPGYWLWLGSMLVTVLASSVAMAEEARQVG